jgi:hypothetical protein
MFFPSDMAIPRGLHVRVNLQTGQREAKLIEPEEENEERFDLSSLGMQEDGDIPPITSTVSAEELKHILHKIEKKEPLVPEEVEHYIYILFRIGIIGTVIIVNKILTNILKFRTSIFLK